MQSLNLLLLVDHETALETGRSVSCSQALYLLLKEKSFVGHVPVLLTEL